MLIKWKEIAKFASCLRPCRPVAFKYNARGVRDQGNSHDTPWGCCRERGHFYWPRHLRLGAIPTTIQLTLGPIRLKLQYDTNRRGRPQSLVSVPFFLAGRLKSVRKQCEQFGG